MQRIRTTFFILLVTTFAPAALMGQAHLGQVDAQTSCTPEAEAQFETGLALLHHMMYDQARQEFRGAATIDSTCALASWGIAMTHLHPLWAPPTTEELQKGRKAVRQAKMLQEANSSTVTDRERAYVSAMDAYFGGVSDRTHSQRLSAWEKALNELHQADPDDVDAGAFYALAHLATAPSTDANLTHQKEAGALLERLHTKAPEHPGPFHYLIHAYDNAALADQAVEIARSYDKIAPSVPHALHMPSHIFVRLGVWPDVISWNARSAEAALEQSPEEYTSMHHAHALDYMMYAYLQQGQDQAAKGVLDEIDAVENYQDSFGAAYGIAAAQARYVLEREGWDDAARLPVRSHTAFPWDKYPHYEAITYFTRGLGAARSGDLDAAQVAIDTLDAFHQRTVEAGEDYWAIQVDAQRKTVAAWRAYADGRHDEGASLMREAADVEDSVDKHPVTPGAVRPARELLGDMLVLLDRPEEAVAEYQAALERSPNRFNSLYGLGLAAERADRSDLANEAYAKLVQLSADGEETREHVARAETFLQEK